VPDFFLIRCVTPEYPSGTYAYFTTTNSSYYPLFPFVIGNAYQGSSGLYWEILEFYLVSNIVSIVCLVSPNGKMVTIPSGVTTYFSYSSTSVNEPEKLFFLISLMITIMGIKMNH